ncbi:probable U3 small nucleolar RNA-associated protein 10 [Zygosaccharomyces bailii ISA1307]|uniref:U3 small nucleolar RNA-associated protein 10 n=1 Tax=Zygosaccharomyces bailii (strain CLIB 213 / ATCC 58445 / CBS 680 / BCRC 21525 / NBRC 1098 / NCYC 1416 / NRRL Y-2227) TaxID=1333698 RepID=A0A8J2T6I6_ZYGB2|nr:ZYBA0S03-11606g1_1 [Zygosaccharomyces bailii CLIB 213]CDH16296.1 probable U3 small nucleolar RNA-associated protein 10 [Zygosaccharomyces bailii ISA1307]
MSSLRDQLSQVSLQNAPVALDRKKRQKLHSASLLYNPKTASTQDYDFIFENALSSLKELIEIEPKFEIFTRTLFSDSSMSIDRSLQSKEEVKDLDKAINGYLMLASSKWHLAPTLHATEWLVRRFQIHICNAEVFLLSTINYYQTSIFKRILDIVKLPPLFHPLSSFVRTDKNPTHVTIIKLFSDLDFLKLYADYLSTCVRQGTTYTGQLLFSSCCFVNLIAYTQNNEERLNTMVPIVLEISAKLLASSSVDCQISAHCMLVVLVTALPLKKAIILAATETILSNLQTGAKRSALITICKLFQTLKGQGNVEQLSDKLYKLFDAKYDVDYLNDHLGKPDSVPSDKFITTYLRALARYDYQNLSSITSLLQNIKLEKFELRLFITDLIHLSEVLNDKSQLISVFEYLVSLNETLVLNCLKSLNVSPEMFEIRLTTSLFSNKEEVSESDIMQALASEKIGNGKTTATLSFKEFTDKNSAFINTSNKSMLAESDDAFGKLLSLFLEAVRHRYSAGQFLSSFFTTLEGRITFLLRILVSPSAPNALRLISLNNISKCINSIDKESNVFALIPCMVCALNDISKNVRIGIKKLFSQISKRPFTKHYFMANRLYGEETEFPLLSPKDGELWLDHFLSEYSVEDHDISKLIIPKKNEKVYLLFWSNQALYIPLPLPKMVLIRNLINRFSTPASYSSIFENFINGYLANRDEWELCCRHNKTNFADFESVIVDLISPKEKNQFYVDFIINALKSDYDGFASIVASKLLKIFGTLKFEQQLHILQSILDTAAADEQSYDAIETLQSLPLTTELFVTILSQNRIHSDSEITELTKKRRRRSSTNKAALQNESVSQIAELHLKKLTIILETLNISKANGSDSLLSTLLSLLSDLETLEQDGGLPVLYTQEVLASCMLRTIHSIEQSSLPKPKHVQADVVVSAIRSSQSPQVQNKLLLVVGALASLDFETVLHSVMPIFTFMGAHSIRQDDEFTSNVVENTIKTIVPALLKGTENEAMDETGFLLVSFTTALQHVPKHRRVKLYTTLVESLDPNKAIAPFLVLIAQQYSSNITNFRLGEGRGLIEFTKSFMANFTVLQQLNGWGEYLSLIKVLIDAQKDDESKRELKLHALFTNNILNLSNNGLLALVQNGFNFMNKVLEESEVGYNDASSNFRVGLYSIILDPRSNTTLVNDVKSKFGMLLENVLNFIKNLNDFSAPMSSDTEDSSSENDAVDAKSDIKGALFTMLGQVLNLLPVDNFVDAVLPLLSSVNDKDIRYQLTLVINTKFEFTSAEVIPTAQRVMKALLQRIPLEQNYTDVLQVSFNTLASLIGQFGKSLDNSLLNECLSLSTRELNSSRTEVIISSMTVVTSCIESLGIKSIAFYSKIVPAALKAIDNNSQEVDHGNLRKQLQLSVLLLFASMVKHIPSIMMSNLQDVLQAIFLADEVETSIRLSIITLMVENVDLKEVLKVLQKLWSNKICQTEDSIAVSLFLSALESTIEAIDKRAATSQSPVFFKLLLQLLEYRSITNFDNNTISRIEASVFEIANSYVLKLNDKVFRPLFVLMVRWAFDGEGVTNTAILPTERLASFFKFFNKLQENLKGIVTSYFTYLLEPVDQLLKKFVNEDIVNVNLRRLTLNCLTSAFKYDKDEYWRSTSRFELICESLVAQLTNVESVIGKYLVKAIASLAANNNQADEHNKFMHKLLVEHMKSNCSSNEKLWTVRALKLIYSKVGESWLVLLPQLVPTIAELLEDDDEQVEREVRSGLVRVVENVLGEPFDRYLD